MKRRRYVLSLSAASSSEISQRSLKCLGHAIERAQTSLVAEFRDILDSTIAVPACKLPVFLLHYVMAEKGVGHAIYGEEGRTVCRGIVQG